VRCSRSSELEFIYPDDILMLEGLVSDRMILLIYWVTGEKLHPPAKAMWRMKTTISICKWAVQATCVGKFKGFFLCSVAIMIRVDLVGIQGGDLIGRRMRPGTT